MFLIGANSRDRTDDLRITNALLYQLSYIGLYKNGVDDSENRAAVNTGLRHDANQHQLQNRLLGNRTAHQILVRLHQNALIPP